MEPKDLEKYGRYYSESKFKEKITAAARKLGVKVVYCALTLYYALFSDSVPKRDRAIIIGALGYLILPVDLLPDFIPLLGYTDDAAALTLALYRVLKNITPEVKTRAKNKAREIFGLDKAADISYPEKDPSIDEQ